MQVSPISQNTTFNGKLSIRNLVTNESKMYRLDTSMDNKLLNLFKEANNKSPFLYGLNAISDGEKNRKGFNKYIDKICELTGDDFVKTLPPLTTTKKGVSNALDATFVYRSFISGDTYTALCTDSFEIFHDITK